MLREKRPRSQVETRGYSASENHEFDQGRPNCNDKLGAFASAWTNWISWRSK